LYPKNTKVSSFPNLTFPQNPLENEDDLSYSSQRILLGREMIL